MSLQRRDLRTMPSDTAAVGQQVLSATSPYRIIGEGLAELLDDEQFAELYAPTGRAAISPSLLALVTVFQFLEDVPDREAASLVAVRLDWKYALHLPLGSTGFDFSVLCYFRGRVLAHGQEGLVFETVLGKLKALGLVKKRGKQRTDALAVLGAVKQLSALETVSETLRLALGALAQADAGWVEQQVPASFREVYLERRSDYRLSAAERQAGLERVGQDGAWLLECLDAAGTPALRGLAAVAVLRTVWAQRYERVAGRLVARAPTVECTERIITPHDPGVRAGQKRGKAWHGEKVHITETAEPGGPNFITDVVTGNAASGDVTALAAVRQHLAARDLLPGEQVVDSGYISGQQLAASEAAGIELIGPPLADTSLQTFKLADFAIDRAAACATCPAGQRSTKWAERTERDGSRAVHIQFPAAVCAACPLRASCTTSRDGRSLSLSEHYARLAARRAEATTEAFKEKLRARAAIEATLSELVRKHGLRRHRYRGDQKRHFENLLKATACNLKRLARVLAAQPAASAAVAVAR